MWVDQANGILLGIVLALKAIAINVKLPLGQLLGKYIRCLFNGDFDWNGI